MLNTCQKCKKNSFVGCGRHLKSIFKNINKENICQCSEILRNFVKMYK